MSTLRAVEAFWEKVCFDPDFQPEGRFQIYRDLVFEGMLEVMHNLCPVICGILGAEEIQSLFWDFLSKVGPQSVVLRQLPWEVSQFLRKGGHPFLEKYPWLGELMEYEYLEIRVRFAEDVHWNPAPGSVALNQAHALGEYTWPVHFISEKRHDPRELPRGDYFIFLWRDPQSLEVKFMEVNALVAGMLRRLERGPLNREILLKETGRDLGIDPSDEYLQEGRHLVKVFTEQGIFRLGHPGENVSDAGK